MSAALIILNPIKKETSLSNIKQIRIISRGYCTELSFIIIICSGMLDHQRLDLLHRLLHTVGAAI